MRKILRAIADIFRPRVTVYTHRTFTINGKGKEIPEAEFNRLWNDMCEDMKIKPWGQSKDKQ